jgi:hypothetical protein
MRILLRALAANVIAIYSPLRRRRRKPDRMAAVVPSHAPPRVRSSRVKAGSVGVALGI